MNTFTRAALTVLVGLCYLVLPHTEAIKPEGWHLLAIFTATVRVLSYVPGQRVLWRFWYCCSRSH